MPCPSNRAGFTVLSLLVPFIVLFIVLRAIGFHSGVGPVLQLGHCPKSYG